MQRALLALACLSLLTMLSACAAGPTVWAVNDGEKIKRNDLDNPHKASNSAWDGKTIRLFGARNEMIAFQVIVEGGERGIKALTVSLPELAQQGGSARIVYAPPALDPTQYVGRPIQVFSENYMDVAKPTNASWYWTNGAVSVPKDCTGWIPVQLVPENARVGKGGFPLTVALRQNQAVWIEIYTARDLPAGTYQGNVQVRADGRTTTLPVRLELFDFTLPDQNSLDTMFFYVDDENLKYHGSTLNDAYHRFAHRNRIELSKGYDPASAEADKDILDGAAFTRERGYEGPGEGVGNRIAARSFYGAPGRLYYQRDTAWKDSDAWMEYFNKYLPNHITFLYLPDEPSKEQFPLLKRMCQDVKANPGPGGKLPLLITHSYTPDLAGLIDIWAAGGGGYRTDVAAEHKAKGTGEQFWTYGGGRPASGALVIDAPATDFRIVPWACFKHEIPVYYFWQINHWYHNPQKPGDRYQNVWVDPITFDNRGQPRKPIVDQGYINGDGVVVYPGQDIVHPEEDRGIPGPCGTIQLGNFRRGFQDHLYLTMARELGLKEQVDDAVKPIVWKVYSDVADADPIGFTESSDLFEQQRYRLGKAIEAARRGDTGMAATKQPAGSK